MALYRLSFEVDVVSAVDPSDLLDRLYEAVDERFWGVDQQTISVLTLDPKAIYLPLKIVPMGETQGEVGPVTKESLARFFKRAGGRGDLSTSTVEGGSAQVLFESLSVE